MTRYLVGAGCLPILFSLSLLFAVACGEERPPVDGTASSSGGPIITSPDGGGGSDSSEPTEAGPLVDAGSCNTLRKTGSLVPVMGIAGDVPSGLGGTILDGVYDLTDAQKFVGVNGQHGDTFRDLASSIQIAGTSFELVSTEQHSDGSATDTRTTATFATSGTKLTLSTTCPATGQVVRDYTVEGRELTLIDSATGDVFVYEKQ